MQKEQIQEFTTKITLSNRTGLTVVTYEILFVYLADAKSALKEERFEDYKQAIRQAQKCISELMVTLNFSYELAAELYRIYAYGKELLAKAMYKRSEGEIEECETLLKMLHESFVKVAETDDSAPLMQNTEQVYAGYTYGRNDVNVNSSDVNPSRGFFV